MRHPLLLPSLLLAAAPIPAAAAPVWIASCTGALRVQYVQTIGAEGYLHLGNSDGSFTTVKLRQVYFDGKIVCGGTSAKPGPKEIGGICADNGEQKIRIEYGEQIKSGVRPGDVATYCDAQVSVN